jgi:hypothetical protein
MGEFDHANALVGEIVLCAHRFLIQSPDAEDAEVTQKTQKRKRKEKKTKFETQQSKATAFD